MFFKIRKKNWFYLGNDWWENKRWSIVVFKKRIENENFCLRNWNEVGKLYFFYQEILWKDYNNDLI